MIVHLQHCSRMVQAAVVPQFQELCLLCCGGHSSVSSSGCGSKAFAAAPTAQPCAIYALRRVTESQMPNILFELAMSEYLCTVPAHSWPTLCCCACTQVYVHYSELANFFRALCSLLCLPGDAGPGTAMATIGDLLQQAAK